MRVLVVILLACVPGCSELLDSFQTCGPEPADSCGDSCDGCYLNHLYACRDGEWEVVAVCEHFPSWEAGPGHTHVRGPIHMELEVIDQTAACDRPLPSERELVLIVRNEHPEIVLGGPGEVVGYEIDEAPVHGPPVVTAKVVSGEPPMSIAVRLELGGSLTGRGTATYAAGAGTCTMDLHVASGTFEIEDRSGSVEDHRRACSVLGCRPTADL